jgi:hypothetical protein
MNESTDKTLWRADETQIDLLALLNAVLKRWWLVVLATVVLGAAAFAGSKVLITPPTVPISPVYQQQYLRGTNPGHKYRLTTSRNLTSPFAPSSLPPGCEAAIRQAGVTRAISAAPGPLVAVGAVNYTEIIRVIVTLRIPRTPIKIAPGDGNLAAESSPAS